MISGYQKVDIALVPTSYSSAEGAQTSAYYDMAKYDKVIFIVTAGTMSASGSISVSILQAKSCTGSGSVALGVYSTMNGAPSSSGLISKAAKVNIACSSESMVLTGGTITINGIVYTAGSSAGYTTGTFTASRVYYASSSDQEKTNYHLAAYINHADYGVPGVEAISASTHSLTLEANDTHSFGGDCAITIVGSTGLSSQLWVMKQIATLEAKSAMLAATSGFNYVACQITVAGTCPAGGVGVMAIRSAGRYSPPTTNLFDYAFGV